MLSPEILGYLASITSIFAFFTAVLQTNWTIKIKATVVFSYFLFALTNILVWNCLVIPPKIYLLENVVNDLNKIVDLQKSPYRVLITGKVENAKNYYTYLIVNDYYHEYIEPVSGLGRGVNNEFSNFCYLGKKDDLDSTNKHYSVSAVVVDRKYQAYDVLDRKTIVSESNKLLFFRTN